MNTRIRTFLLVIVAMMCFLLPGIAAAGTEYEDTFDMDEIGFNEPIYINGSMQGDKLSYIMNGKQIAEWNASNRTFTVRGPLDLTTKQGFVSFDSASFDDDKKNVTIVIEGHVSLGAEEEGHVIDAWVGEDEEGNPFPFTFELTVTGTGYNASNPSASTSSLTIAKSELNGIQSSIINVNNLYIPELNTNLIGMYCRDGMTLSNVTIESAASENGSVLEGADGFGGNLTLNNVTINSLASGEGINGVNAPGTLTIRNSQISNLRTGDCGMIGQNGVVMENSKLTNTFSVSPLITAFDDNDIAIQNCELSSIEVEDGYAIYTTGALQASNLKVDTATLPYGLLIGDAKVTVTDSTFNKITTNEEYIFQGEGGVVMNNSKITNSKAVVRGAALGGGEIQMVNSTITDFTGENIVSCSGNISIKDSTLSGTTTWSSVWAGGDLSISGTTLTATSTDEGAPGLDTITGNFTLNGISGKASKSPTVRITPDSTPIPFLETKTTTESALVNGTPSMLFAHPHNKMETEAQEFGKKYLGMLSNEELNEKYSFKLEAGKGIKVVSNDLYYGAKPCPLVYVQATSKDAEGQTVTITMSSKETGDAVYVRKYVFSLKGERVLTIDSSDHYTHEFISGTGEVLTVYEGSDLSINVGHKGIGTALNMSYEWINSKTKDLIGTGSAFSLTDIRKPASIACIAMNGSTQLEMIFFEIQTIPAPAVEVEDQTAEQKQNNTVTVVVPDETIEQVIETSSSSVVELPVEYAPVDSQTAVTTTKVSEEAFNKLADTNKAVSIPLDHAEVVLQPEVVEQIAASAAAGSEIEITVEQKKPQEALNTAQMQSFENQKVAAVITADVFMKEGEKRTKIDFRGKVTLKVPFTPPAGESGHDYVIVYVADNGQVETLATYYTDGHLVFETNHFSDFVITTRTTDVSAPVSVPKTGDNASPVLWLMGMLLAGSCAILLGKRRQMN